MKFSFNKSASKIKQNPLHSFQSIAPITIDAKHHESKQSTNVMYASDYQAAIQYAEKGNFSESLRSFDRAIRFWCIHLEELKTCYPHKYKQFKFAEINTCDASNYFLNLHKKKKEKEKKKTKKKLWKPPAKHQPQNYHDTNNDDDDDEIIYFDTDSDDVNVTENEHKLDIEIQQWQQSLLEHRQTGSKMYEYHAQVLLETDRDFEAIKASQSAILLNDLNAINWLTLSRAELNFGDPFQALLSVSRAIELDYENDEIVQQYSNVYGICNKLKEMKKYGQMSDNVLKRRLQSDAYDHMNDIKSMKKRLDSRQENQMDSVKLLHTNRKTETQNVVDSYQNMVHLTKKLDINSNAVKD